MIVSRFAGVITDAFSLMQTVWGVNDAAARMSSEIAVLVMTTAGQETGWRARWQEGGGPARSYWQFEEEGLQGALQANASRALSILSALDITSSEAFDAIAYNDTLACCMARLNYWSVPAPLPMLGDVTGSYAYYLHTWRPGAPDETRWPDAYRTSVAAFPPVAS